jgi:hypothetical protein
MPTQHTPLVKLEVYLQNSIRDAVTALEFLHTHREKLEKLNLSFSHPYGSYIDFDHLSRPDLLKVLRVFGGKWDKSPGYNGGLTYTRQDQVDGFTLRCYNGEPPPSCRIVETVKWVKVPAKREKVVTRTVVCK